jgi:hypothetical protein
MDKDQTEQRWDRTMGQTAISCTDRKLPGSLPELRLTIADKTEYKDQAIVDTGAIDHICNNHDRFISFERTRTCSAIKTGAAIIKVKATGTIQLSILQSNGSINVVRFSKVLYAPDMFVSSSLTPKYAKKAYTTMAGMRRSTANLIRARSRTRQRLTACLIYCKLKMSLRLQEHKHLSQLTHLDRTLL